MGRTRIDGDQVQDESLTGVDILDESVKSQDVDLEDLTTGLVNDPVAIATINSGIVFGSDFTRGLRETTQVITGNQFVNYSTLTFNVSETSGNNIYRLNIDFLWGLDSASTDGRFQMYLDGSEVGSQLQIEPKDQGNDQRVQNNILFYAENLSQGSHTLELRVRPSQASRDLSLYRAISEVKRVA